MRVAMKKRSTGLWEHLKEGIEGFVRLFNLEKGLYLEKIKTGIALGVKLYSKSLMNSPDEMLS